MSLADEVLRGDFLSLGRAITLVENGSPEGRRLVDALAPRIGGAFRIGVTGPPGVGKSTTIDGLVASFRACGEKVAVLAVDPTSPFSGGALLGDRIRMARTTETGDVFVRSMATRGAGGGLARAAQDAADLLDAAGRTVVLIETVGAGQSEVDVSRVADCVVVILSPESGDGVQALKSGLLEIADLLVINKADRPGADRLEQDLRTAFELGSRPPRDIRILLTEACRGKGIAELVAAINSFMRAGRENGAFERRRRCNLEERLKRIVEHLLRQDLWDADGAARRFDSAVEAILRGRQPLYQSAQGLVDEVMR